MLPPYLLGWGGQAETTLGSQGRTLYSQEEQEGKEAKHDHY